MGFDPSKDISWLILYLAYISQVFSPILTFAVYTIIAKKNGSDSALDFNRVFTSLSLFALLSEPLQSLIMALVTFLGSVGCFTRIQEFLDKTTRVDPRRKPTNTTDDYVEFAHSTHGLDLPDNRDSVTTEKTHVSSFKSRLSFPFKDVFNPNSGNNAITIQDGCFGWDVEQEPLLKSISIRIPRGKFTMLVGPVGCGKSTLLKALLGEVPAMGGIVEVASLNMAFCDQTPWHMNQSIRESIVTVAEFDEKWYESVINACGLEEDLRQLPRGDHTIVGSKGVALSGGQSQRIVSFSNVTFYQFYTNIVLVPCQSHLRTEGDCRS